MLKPKKKSNSHKKTNLYKNTYCYWEIYSYIEKEYTLFIKKVGSISCTCTGVFDMVSRL